MSNMAKIMLVEDDRSLQEIYSIRLVAEGYEIARADDGEEALAKAVQEKPDLIIADVMMPKISGFDMLDILRSQPETQNIKVIMMTALSSDDQRQRGEALGAERYLVKSQVGIEDVINAVHEVLGDKPKADAKANIETLSNIPAAPAAPAPAPAPAAPAKPAAPATPTPAPAAPAPAPAPAPVPPKPVASAAPAAVAATAAATAATAASVAAAANALASVPTIPTTTIQPTNPVAGPAPQPAPQPVPPAMPTNGTPQNFNQAPAAKPGMVPSMQTTLAPAAGATTAPAVASQVVTNNPVPPANQPTPVVVQEADRVMPGGIPTPQPSDNVDSAEKPVKEERASGGERVIQPIHDPRRDSMREQMQKRMEEILGEDAEGGDPQAITTKTARKIKDNSAPTSEPEPRAKDEVTPPEGVATLETPEQTVDDKPEPQPAPRPESTADEEKPNDNQKTNEKKVEEAVANNPKAPEVAEEKPQPTPKAPEPAEEKPQPTPKAPEPAEEKPQPSPKAPEPVEEKKPEEEEEVVEAIQPAYIASLEEELSAEAQENIEQTMADRMANELKDDEITKVAQEKAAAAIAEAAKAPKQPDTKSESETLVENAVASVLTSPNIAQASDATPQPTPEQKLDIKIVATEPTAPQTDSATPQQNGTTEAK